MKCECCQLNEATVKDYREICGELNTYYVCSKCLHLSDEIFMTKIKGERYGIVKIHLRYKIPLGKEPMEYLENIELPSEYIEDSFEVVEIQ